MPPERHSIVAGVPELSGRSPGGVIVPWFLRETTPANAGGPMLMQLIGPACTSSQSGVYKSLARTCRAQMVPDVPGIDAVQVLLVWFRVARVAVVKLSSDTSI